MNALANEIRPVADRLAAMPVEVQGDMLAFGDEVLAALAGHRLVIASLMAMLLTESQYLRVRVLAAEAARGFSLPGAPVDVRALVVKNVAALTSAAQPRAI